MKTIINTNIVSKPGNCVYVTWWSTPQFVDLVFRFATLLSSETTTPVSLCQDMSWRYPVKRLQLAMDSAVHLQFIFFKDGAMCGAGVVFKFSSMPEASTGWGVQLLDAFGVADVTLLTPPPPSTVPLFACTLIPSKPGNNCRFHPDLPQWQPVVDLCQWFLQ
jgi:hypothetical protein